jgi:hypothetical protein
MLDRIHAKERATKCKRKATRLNHPERHLFNEQEKYLREKTKKIRSRPLSDTGARTSTGLQIGHTALNENQQGGNEAGQQKIVRVGLEEQVADFGRELRIHITTARHQKKSDPHERQNKDFPAARKI